MILIDREIRTLFLIFEIRKDSFNKELETATDEKTKVNLKKEIEGLENAQLRIIEDYIELVGFDLPLEMQCYFTGEKLHIDDILKIYDRVYKDF